MKIPTNILDKDAILIFGKKDLEPMNLEISIAETFPHLDEKTYSYENYDDAYDCAKDKKNFSIIMLIDSAVSTPMANIFDNLSRHYQNNGLESVGVMISAEERLSLSSARLLSIRKNVIGPYSLSDLLDKEKSVYFFEEIFDQYGEKLKQQILPTEFHQSLLDLCKVQQFKTSSNEFQERVIRLLCSKANVPILTSHLLPIVPLIRTIYSQYPEIIRAQSHLDRFYLSLITDKAYENFDQIQGASLSIEQKILLSADLLLSKVDEGLERFLIDFKSSMPSHLQGITKVIKNCQDQIIKFNNEASSKTVTTRLRVA